MSILERVLCHEEKKPKIILNKVSSMSMRLYRIHISQLSRIAKSTNYT